MMDEGGLMALLDLRPLGDDAYEAVATDDGWHRLFGGQVASQSLRAATLTVEPDRPVHSMHAYFIRPGRPGIPLHLAVDRTRDGRSFATRRVTASQQDEAIFVLAASFHISEEGNDWQLPPPLDLGDPEDAAANARGSRRFAAMSPFELRPLKDPGPEGFPATHPFWVKVRERLPDDPALHASALAFISDMGVVPASRAPGSTKAIAMGASLDHALWFHRPTRADEWLLFSVEPVSNFGGRGLARGSLHDRDGRLVMSMTQETIIRNA
jgi:acyl-CoA thioesterase-2